MVRSIGAMMLIFVLFGGIVGCASAGEGAAAPAPTLAPGYPLERLPLPEGSAVEDYQTFFDGGKRTDYVLLTLPMSRTEAAAYFGPLLEAGSEAYVESEADVVPLEIRGAYPGAGAQLELFARYADASMDWTVLRVSLYTLADLETVAAAQIQVSYRAGAR